MENSEIHVNITFSHNFPQHVQISCLKNQHGKNHIVCLTVSFKIGFTKKISLKVKIIHTKINHIFSRNKSASKELHNYPIHMVFFCK